MALLTSLYLCSRTVYAAVGTPTGSGARVLAAAQTELPEGCLINGVITNEADLTAALKEFFTANKLPMNRVALIAGGSQFMHRILTLPAMSEKKRRAIGFWSWHAVRVAALVLIAAAVLSAGAFGLKSLFSTDGKTTRLGYEDIGQLATQAAYCTEVKVAEKSAELWGLTIPFTQSKYIYSYDVEVKAGFDFGAITWSVDRDRKTIRVKLPQVQVLSTELKLDSFKVYYEAESIFQRFSLAENNQAMTELKEQAQADAIANGILDSARTDGETILSSFFANAYDLDQYELIFI